MYENVWKIMKENKFEFYKKISHELKCSICNELMIKACIAPCGCRFCSDCVENYLDGNDKFCPGESKRCQKKMINYTNDIVVDYPTNIKISEIVVKCPRRNCQFQDELERIENHMRTCDKSPISCPYHEIGCEMNEFMKDEMKDHLNEENYCHSKLLMDLINNLRNEIQSVKNEIIELRKENNQLKQKIDKLEWQSTDQNQQIFQLESKERENASEIEKLNQEIVAVKNENKSIKTEMQTNVESINRMRQINKIIEIQSIGIDEIKQNYLRPLEKNEEIEMIKGEINKIYEQNANFETRLNDFDETFKQIIDENVNNLQMKMIEMEMKLENLEIDGELFWKFENLSDQERDTFIYSKPFYSGKSEYKMCLSIIIGSEDEIFVYFHLMRGKFDYKLSWPFKYPLTIDVIDQQNGNIDETHTIKYSDCSNENNRWNKPSKDIDDGVWCNHWIPFNSSVIRNDQIMIKCRVEREK